MSKQEISLPLLGESSTDRDTFTLLAHEDVGARRSAELPLEDILQKLNTSQLNGLDEDQVEARRLFYGPNELPPPKEHSLPVLFLIQMFGGFGPLMWVACILSFISWKPLGKDDPDSGNLTLALLLLIVIILQALFSLFQEVSSKKAMQSIAGMASADVSVLRSSTWASVPSGRLVLGDVVKLEAGIKIPADIRIIEANELKLDASGLTGESLPITGEAGPQAECSSVTDAPNLALFGSTIVDGSGVGIVVAVGEKTELGKTAALAAKTPNRTSPVQREINKFVFVIVVLSLVTGVFLLLFWRLYLMDRHPSFIHTPQMVINVISLIVAYVPIGMPLAITLTLRNVAVRMQKRNLLVKQLSSVDTLGCTSIILSDKTGTITENRMKVRHFSVGGEPADGIEDTPSKLDHHFERILSAASLCNGAANATIGSATDTAILRLNESIAASHPALAQHWMQLPNHFPRVDVVPFNSRNKWMLTINKEPKDELGFLLLKGAPEVVMRQCTTRATRGDAAGRRGTGIAESGDSLRQLREVPLDPDSQAQAHKTIEALAAKGERVIAVARRTLSLEETRSALGKTKPASEYLRGEMCLLGFLAMEDPPRQGVKEAVELCRTAGVRVAMVTGDHAATAQAISEQISLITHETVHTLSDFSSEVAVKVQETGSATCDAALVITGPEVDQLQSDTAWDWVVAHDEVVFARTTPEHKLRIVQAYQARGHVVAVSGDGVNDAAALKCSDIGVAMGAGTEVAKEAAGIVLMDSSFTSITAGVEQGRLVYDNIKKVVLYLLPAGSFSSLIPILVHILLGVPQPLSPFHMVIIPLMTDLFPSLALVYETAESDIMKRPPRNTRTQTMVDKRLLIFAYCNTGMCETLSAFLLFFYYMRKYGGFDASDLFLAFDKWADGYKGRTAAELDDTLFTGQCVFFVTLVILQFANALSVRTRRVSALPPHKTNYRLFGAILVSLIIALFVVYLPPFERMIKSRPIPAEFWFLPLVPSLLFVGWDELRKYCIRNDVPILRNFYW